MSPREIEAEIWDGREALATLFEEWRSLYERTDNASPFLSPSWASAFVENGRICGKPIIIVAKHRGELVALWPLVVRHFLGTTIAEPIGTKQPSYLGVLVDPAYPTAISCIVDLFIQQRVAQIFYNIDLYSKDKATNELFDELSKRGFLYLKVYRNPCYRINLEGSFDEYLKVTKNSFQRRRLRRNEKRVNEIGIVKVERYTGREITSEIVTRMAKIQCASWMKRRGAAVFMQSFYQKLLLQMAEAGFCRAWLMTIGGSDAAFALGFISHNILHYYWIAFDLKYESSTMAAGQLLTTKVVEDAFSDRLLYLDFSHGDARYKRFWANECHSVYRAICARSLWGKAVSRGYYAIWLLARIKWLHSLYRRIRKKVRRIDQQSDS